MADNIFDAQRDRRIAVLQQQSVSNLVRRNPNLRGVLTRYEDAEVSRLHLLQLQQMRNKKITAGEKALLKTLRKGRRATGGGGRVGRGGKKVKVKRRIPDTSGPLDPATGQPLTTKLVEVEEFVGKDQQIGEGGSTDPIDPELARDKLRLEQDKLKEEREGRRQTGRLALEDRRQARTLATRERGQRQIQFEAKQRQQLAIEDRAVLRSEAERDARIRESDNQLRDVQDRVRRDDAFRHAQLQQQQQLALAHLADRQQDNERAHREQQYLIDNQRAVNADRAVSDREIIGGLQSRITQLERQQFPEGQGQVEVVSDSPSPKARAKSPSPEPEPQATLSSQQAKSVPSKQRQLSLQSKEKPVNVPIVEATTSGREVKKPKRFEGGATEEEIQLELQPQSSIQSVDSTPASTLRSQSPEVYRPKVKTLKEVREDNPVGGGD